MGHTKTSYHSLEKYSLKMFAYSKWLQNKKHKSRHITLGWRACSENGNFAGDWTSQSLSENIGQSKSSMLNHVEGSSLQSHAYLSCCYKLVANHPTAQRPSGMETTKCIPIETNAIGGGMYLIWESNQDVPTECWYINVVRFIDPPRKPNKFPYSPQN